MCDAPADVEYEIGLRDAHRAAAARLYDEAFGPKLSVAVRSRDERLAMLEDAFVGEFAITATVGPELAGLAGFHTPDGSLTGGFGAGSLLRRLGPFRGLRAVAILALYDRTPRPGELLMDGIAVREDFRGRGVGGELLRRIVSHSAENGFSSVRLDVIDTNPDARRLYDRHGFVPVRSETFPFLRRLLGFGGATTMERRVDRATGRGP